MIVQTGLEIFRFSFSVYAKRTFYDLIYYKMDKHTSLMALRQTHSLMCLSSLEQKNVSGIYEIKHLFLHNSIVRFETLRYFQITKFKLFKSLGMLHQHGTPNL